jgi:NAD(P)-dependent dehydrogenase (short-subunit alcohol dehydrogenase family)
MKPLGFGCLQDKRAVITGGYSGNARAIGIAFVREGTDISFRTLRRRDQAARPRSAAIMPAAREEEDAKAASPRSAFSHA